MTSASKDDADHLAAYAENLLARVKAIMVRRAASEEEAAALLLRAKIAIREAKAQLIAE